MLPAKSVNKLIDFDRPKSSNIVSFGGKISVLERIQSQTYTHTHTHIASKGNRHTIQRLYHYSVNPHQQFVRLTSMSLKCKTLPLKVFFLGCRNVFRQSCSIGFLCVFFSRSRLVFEMLLSNHIFAFSTVVVVWWYFVKHVCIHIHVFPLNVKSCS